MVGGHLIGSKNPDRLKGALLIPNSGEYFAVKSKRYLCSAKKKWLMSFFMLTKYMGVEGRPSSWLVK